MNKIQKSRHILCSAIVLVIPVIWIASAYAANLSTLGLVGTTGKFQTLINSKAKPGDIDLFVTDEPLMPTDVAPNLKHELVPHSEAFLKRWLIAVNAKPNRLLWSSYPASIRGQLFSGDAAGGDPFRVGLGGSSGW